MLGLTVNILLTMYIKTSALCNHESSPSEDNVYLGGVSVEWPKGGFPAQAV